MKIKKIHIKDSWVWIAITVFIAGTLILTGVRRRITKVEQIQITISDSASYHFVTKKALVKMLSAKVDPIGKSITSINKKQIEELVNSHPAVKSSEIFVTTNGKLNIELTQKMPIVRVVSETNRHFYIDENGSFFPVIASASARVLVSSGYIPNINIDSKKYGTAQSLQDSLPVFNNIYNLALYMRNDSLLKPLIEQVYITGNDEVKLTPKVGDYSISFGDFSDYEIKFEKLKAIYKTGFKYAGWNRYKTINLAFKNQVVCTKRGR